MSVRQNTTNRDELQEKAVLTVREVIELLGGALSRGSVYKALQKNEIPHRKIGKRILVRRDTLLQWLSGDATEVR
jgi:excisionase family DNA binding protein